MELKKSSKVAEDALADAEKLLQQAVKVSSSHQELFDACSEQPSVRSCLQAHPSGFDVAEVHSIRCASKDFLNKTRVGVPNVAVCLFVESHVAPVYCGRQPYFAFRNAPCCFWRRLC